VLRGMKMPGRVFVLGRVAASHMAAGHAETQVYPFVSHFEAFLTPGAGGLNVVNVFQVSTF